MGWASDEAGAKSKRFITVPTSFDGEFIQDDGVLCERQKCPLLSEGHTKLILKFTNSRGYPISKHIGDEYTIEIIPNPSIALPKTISLNSYSILNHDDHCISITENAEYFHMFVGTIHDKKAAVTINILNASENYTGTILNLGKGNII